MSRLLSTRHDSFNSSAGTILPEARESDIRSTSTSTSLDVDVDSGVGLTLGIGLHPHAHGLAHTRDSTHGHSLTQPRATAAGNNVASLSSARVLMPANTLGRELIELMQNQDLDGLMQSNSQESQEFASMVHEYTQLDSASQSRTDLRGFISRSNPDLAAFVNPSMTATDLLAQIQAGNPGMYGGIPSSPIKPDIYNTHAPITHANAMSIPIPTHNATSASTSTSTSASPFAPAAPSSYPPRVEAFRPTSAHSNHSAYSHHSHTHRHRAGSAGGSAHSAHSAHSNASASDYEYCTTEVDEDESRLPIELRGPVQVDVDPKQLHIGAAGVGGSRGRKKANGRVGDGESGGLWPEGTALPHMPSAGKAKGEYDEETLRLKRLEHRRQINRKSAQKHRMRRREEHESLSKQMVEKDARIAQLEKDLAVERSKTAQLQQFIDMQRMGSKRAARSGGRSGDDVEMDDEDESLPAKRRKN